MTVAELTTPGAVVVVIDPRRAVVTELRTFANTENGGGSGPASSAEQTLAAYLRVLVARERDYARSVTATAAAQSPAIESAPASASSVLSSMASESGASMDDARAVERRLPQLVVLLAVAPTRDVYVRRASGTRASKSDDGACGRRMLATRSKKKMRSWSPDLIEALTAWSLPGLAALTEDGAGCLLIDVNSIVHSERSVIDRRRTCPRRTERRLSMGRGPCWAKQPV